MSLKRWWNDHKHDLHSVVSVEPLALFFIMGMVLSVPPSQALYIQKICLQKYSDVKICGNLSAYPEQQDYVQTQTSHFLFYGICIETVLATVASSFTGSWGDKINRKIPMILPIVGLLFGNLNYFVNSLYMGGAPELLLISPLNGILGGFPTFALSVFSYVSVVSQGSKERMIRISIMEGIMQLGSALALVISGPLVERGGFPVAFGVSSVSALIALIYTVVWIRNPPSKESVDENNVDDKRHLCSRLFECSHFQDSVRCFFKQRKGYRRFAMWTCLVIFMMAMLSAGGSMDTSLLFLRYSIPNWTLTLYGTYSGVRSILLTIGLMLILPLMKKFLALRDTTLVIIGQVSSVSGLILLAFSKTVWMVMLVPLANMLAGFSGAAVRAILAKMVETHEQGKMFAFLGCAQALSVLLASVIFNNLYPATLHFFPGLSNLLCALLTVIAMGLTITLRYYIRMDEITDTKDETMDNSALVTNEAIAEAEQYAA